jgi:hypothetical protein
MTRQRRRREKRVFAELVKDGRRKLFVESLKEMKPVHTSLAEKAKEELSTFEREYYLC